MRALGAGSYTRVTLAGSGRRVDVVVPSGEPVGRLLPEALRLVGEPPGTAPASRSLARLDGTLLHPQASLGEAGVADGSILRVVGVADAPPPPVVLDVTEEVADGLESRAWRWGPEPRRWSATALAVAAALLAGHLGASRLGSLGGAALLLGGALVLLLVGMVLSHGMARGPGMAAILAGAGLGIYAAWSLPSSPEFALRASLAVLAMAALALGASTGLGRGGVVGGAAGILLVGAWGLALGGLGPARAAALLAVVSVVLLGLVPRYALAASGLTVLDDRRARDEAVTPGEVGQALTTAHRGLALTAVAIAVSAAAAGWLLAADAGRWTVPLAVLLAVVLAVRCRSFPLVLPVVAALGAAAIVAAALLLAWLRAAPQQWPLVVGVVAVAGVAAAGATQWQVPEHARARARRLADRTETVAVLAMAPVLAGVFGVYARLLQAA